MVMDIGTILIAFGFLILGVLLVYVLYRLLTDPTPEVDPRSARLLRWLGNPKFFDPIFAKPLTKREKFGWLLFFVIAVLAIIFT
jgi:hypothetical protein